MTWRFVSQSVALLFFVSTAAVNHLTATHKHPVPIVSSSFFFVGAEVPSSYPPLRSLNGDPITTTSSLPMRQYLPLDQYENMERDDGRLYDWDGQGSSTYRPSSLENYVCWKDRDIFFFSGISGGGYPMFAIFENWTLGASPAVATRVFGPVGASSFVTPDCSSVFLARSKITGQYIPDQQAEIQEIRDIFYFKPGTTTTYGSGSQDGFVVSASLPMDNATFVPGPVNSSNFIVKGGVVTMRATADYPLPPLIGGSWSDNLGCLWQMDREPPYLLTQYVCDCNPPTSATTAPLQDGINGSASCGRIVPGGLKVSRDGRTLYMLYYDPRTPNHQVSLTKVIQQGNVVGGAATTTTMLVTLSNTAPIYRTQYSWWMHPQHEGKVFLFTGSNGLELVTLDSPGPGEQVTLISNRRSADACRTCNGTISSRPTKSVRGFAVNETDGSFLIFTGSYPAIRVCCLWKTDLTVSLPVPALADMIVSEDRSPSPSGTPTLQYFSFDIYAKQILVADGQQSLYRCLPASRTTNIYASSSSWETLTEVEPLTISGIVPKIEAFVLTLSEEDRAAAPTGFNSTATMLYFSSRGQRVIFNNTLGTSNASAVVGESPHLAVVEGSGSSGRLAGCVTMVRLPDQDHLLCAASESNRCILSFFPENSSIRIFALACDNTADQNQEGNIFTSTSRMLTGMSVGAEGILYVTQQNDGGTSLPDVVSKIARDTIVHVTKAPERTFASQMFPLTNSAPGDFLALVDGTALGVYNPTRGFYSLRSSDEVNSTVSAIPTPPPPPLPQLLGSWKMDLANNSNTTHAFPKGMMVNPETGMIHLGAGGDLYTICCLWKSTGQDVNQIFTASSEFGNMTINRPKDLQDLATPIYRKLGWDTSGLMTEEFKYFALDNIHTGGFRVFLLSSTTAIVKEMERDRLGLIASTAERWNYRNFPSCFQISAHNASLLIAGSTGEIGYLHIPNIDDSDRRSGLFRPSLSFDPTQPVAGSGVANTGFTPSILGSIPRTAARFGKISDLAVSPGGQDLFSVDMNLFIIIKSTLPDLDTNRRFACKVGATGHVDGTLLNAECGFIHHLTLAPISSSGHEDDCLYFIDGTGGIRKACDGYVTLLFMPATTTMGAANNIVVHPFFPSTFFTARNDVLQLWTPPNSQEVNTTSATGYAQYSGLGEIGSTLDEATSSSSALTPKVLSLAINRRSGTLLLLTSNASFIEINSLWKPAKNVTLSTLTAEPGGELGDSYSKSGPSKSLSLSKVSTATSTATLTKLSESLSHSSDTTMTENSSVSRNIKKTESLLPKTESVPPQPANISSTNRLRGEQESSATLHQQQGRSASLNEQQRNLSLSTSVDVLPSKTEPGGGVAQDGSDLSGFSSRTRALLFKPTVTADSHNSKSLSRSETVSKELPKEEEEEELSPEVVKTTQTTVSVVAGAATAASVVGSGAAAVDAQSLAVIGLMSCTQSSNQKAMKNNRLLSPLATGDSYEGMILGNWILVVLAVALHVCVSALVKMFKKLPSWAEAQALVKFPTLTIVVLTIQYQGTAASAVKLLQEQGGSSLPTISMVLGITTLVFSFCLPVALVLLAHHCISSTFYEYDYTSATEAKKGQETVSAASPPSSTTTTTPPPPSEPPREIPKWLQILFPQGKWMPLPMRRRFSTLFAGYRRSEKIWVSLPTWSPTVIIIGLLFKPSSKSGCVAQFGTMAAVEFLLASIILLFRPHRSPVSSVLAAASNMCLGFVLVGSALQASADEANGAMFTIRGVQAQMAITVLRLLWSLSQFVIEAKVLAKHRLVEKPGTRWMNYEERKKRNLEGGELKENGSDLIPTREGVDCPNGGDISMRLLEVPCAEDKDPSSSTAPPQQDSGGKGDRRRFAGFDVDEQVLAAADTRDVEKPLPSASSDDENDDPFELLEDDDDELLSGGGGRNSLGGNAEGRSAVPNASVGSPLLQMQSSRSTGAPVHNALLSGATAPFEGNHRRHPAERKVIHASRNPTSTTADVGDIFDFL